MRVTDRELGAWSFLMSTAHGAGLMVAPIMLGLRASHGTIAFVVYERVGLQVLRKAWLNTDHVWAASFILAGLITLTS
jgi:hypothetical protein